MHRYNLKEIEERLDIKRGRLREWANNQYIRGLKGSIVEEDRAIYLD